MSAFQSNFQHCDMSEQIKVDPRFDSRPVTYFFKSCRQKLSRPVSQPRADSTNPCKFVNTNDIAPNKPLN